VSEAREIESCLTCGDAVGAPTRVVLVRGRRQRVYCSDTCLRADLDARRARRNRLRLRVALAVVLPTALVVAVKVTVQRHRAPARQSISLAWGEGLPAWSEPPPPVIYGPPWPPTDEQWTAVFEAASWSFPLPGPSRRALAADDHIYGPERPSRCRASGRCGLDLGGELWGEHVYAALDGVVDRVQGDGAAAERRGGQYVRLSHFGGMAFTQYFHLASTPRGLYRGAHVKAGDLIGLVGDTGLPDETPRHLHFTLSVRASPELTEVYWDATPWLSEASLRSPTHGTVAGFVP
jgi:murein DD-endopeptidase MepM/ murein hydrolase activator NlpD